MQLLFIFCFLMVLFGASARYIAEDADMDLGYMDSNADTGYKMEPVDFMEDKLYTSDDTGDELFLKAPSKTFDLAPSEKDYENQISNLDEMM